MTLPETRPDVLELCVEHLGERAGRQVAALARTGLRLDAVHDDELAAGECGVGGPALLEPGTPWPEYESLPLSLLAVLDTDALAPDLGEQLPCRPGLLNFFTFDPDIPYEEFRRLGDHADDPRTWRVVAADPARAEEVPAPEQARSYAWSPLRATPMTTFPDVWEDEVVRTLDLGPAHDDLPPFLLLRDFHTAWRESGEPTLEGGAHQAFGWPSLLQGGVMPGDGGHTHLLQIDPFDQWSYGDAGVVYFTMPTEALRAGDFGQVMFQGQSC